MTNLIYYLKCTHLCGTVCEFNIILLIIVSNVSIFNKNKLFFIPLPILVLEYF